MILAPENDLLVDVVEDPIQVPGELSNPGQMDVSLHDFRTEKMRTTAFARDELIK
jgi:hypothetical protein